MTRFVLYAIALLSGSYAALTWSVALLTHAGIAGAVSAAAFTAAEAIRYCRRRNRGKTPIYPQWVLTAASRPDIQYDPAGPGVWTVSGYDGGEPYRTVCSRRPRREINHHVVMPDSTPVWPHEAGAPE